jgi:hypothetical protein
VWTNREKASAAAKTAASALAAKELARLDEGVAITSQQQGAETEEFSKVSASHIHPGALMTAG